MGALRAWGRKQSLGTRLWRLGPCSRGSGTPSSKALQGRRFLRSEGVCGGVDDTHSSVAGKQMDPCRPAEPPTLQERKPGLGQAVRMTAPGQGEMSWSNAPSPADPASAQCMWILLGQVESGRPAEPTRVEDTDPRSAPSASELGTVCSTEAHHGRIGLMADGLVMALAGRGGRQALDEAELASSSPSSPNR